MFPPLLRQLSAGLLGGCYAIRKNMYHVVGVKIQLHKPLGCTIIIIKHPLSLHLFHNNLYVSSPQLITHTSQITQSTHPSNITDRPTDRPNRTKNNMRRERYDDPSPSQEVNSHDSRPSCRPPPSQTRA
jgi:hypothetical protein